MAGWARRLVVPVLCAAALGAVFASRVFVSFDGVRVKLVRTPLEAGPGALAVASSGDARAWNLEAPLALIAVIGNPAAVSQRFIIRVDGRAVCEAQVPAGASRRVDCAVTSGWPRAAPPVIEVAGPDHRWTLEFLEVATHHGASTRLVPFYITPAASLVPERAAPVWWFVVWVVVAVLWVLPRPTTWPGYAHHVHLLLVVIAAGWLVAVVLAPWLSPYLIVMPVRSFVAVTGVILAPQLIALWHRLLAAAIRLVRAPWIRRPGVGVAAVALLALLPYGLAVRHSARQFNDNYSGLLRISERSFDRSPLVAGRHDIRASLALLPDDGYDAQFMFLAAFDPLMRRFHDQPERYRDAVDAAPYRFGRIGFVWLVRGLALDRWRWYPAVMIGLVLLGIAGTAGAIAWLAQAAGRSVWWGLLVLAVPGFWQSVRVVLPEPLAAATLLAGYGCLRQRRHVLAFGFFAISLLIRETGLVLLALLVLRPLPAWSPRVRGWIAAAAVPLILWRLYVAGVLWSDWGWEGLLYSASNVGIPLKGIVDVWSAIAHGTYFPEAAAVSRAATWYPVVLLVTGGVIWRLRQALDRRVALALGVYVVLSLSLTFPVIWGHVGNAQRGSYEMFLLLFAGAAAAPAWSPRDRAVLAACVVLCAAFILFGAHDALETRDALFP